MKYIIKAVLTICVAVLCMLNCSAQYIKIHVEKNGESVALKKNFKLVLIKRDSVAKMVFVPKMESDSFKFPDAYTTHDYFTLLLRNGNDYFGFDSVKVFYTKQDIAITFGIADKKHFSAVLPKISSDLLDVAKKNSFQIFEFVKFSPQEHGLGLITTQFILNRKKANRILKRMMQTD